jgi:hypothetical protein
MTPKDTFTITAGPGTDIWRKPPTTDVFNGNDPNPPPLHHNSKTHLVPPSPTLPHSPDPHHHHFQKTHTVN